MSARPPTTIARQVALGFGLVAVIATLMGGFLVVQLTRVGDLVAHMQHDEHAIRHGSELATAVREQYMHLAHTVIEGNDSHLGHFADSAAQVHRLVEDLAHRVPEAERWRLERIAEGATALRALLLDELLPALTAGRDVRAANRRAIVWSNEMAAHGDEVARLVEDRMAGAHTSATSVTRLGLIVGGGGVALVLALSVGYTVRLRATILQPMGRLAEAAQRVGGGDLRSRIGHIGGGEIQAVADAFDHMAGELAGRERRLLEAERMAAIGQLAAGVAHEMNNPIGIIRGYLRTMDPTDDPTQLREELQILDEEATACQRIAEDLLAYARAPVLDRRPIALQAFVNEAVERLDGVLGSTPIEVVVAPAQITADPARLRQVLANLLRNAAAATPPGHGVRVEGGPVEGGVRVRVLDRGPGVPADLRARVFEPFFTRRAGGSGLGLAVCQGLVRAHGGRLTVADRPGGGAAFEIDLPHAEETA